MSDLRQPMTNTLVPMVVEQTNRGERAYDIYLPVAERADHLSDRADLRQWSPASSAPSFCSWNRRTRRRTSPSTSTRRAAWFRLAWRCTTPCNTCGRDVSTVCIGQAASAGSLLLMAGAKGKRFALPNSQDHGPSALGRLSGPGDRHRDPRQGDSGDPRAAERTSMPSTPARIALEKIERRWSATFMTPEPRRRSSA